MISVTAAAQNTWIIPVPSLPNGLPLYCRGACRGGSLFRRSTTERRPSLARSRAGEIARLHKIDSSKRAKHRAYLFVEDLRDEVMLTSRGADAKAGQALGLQRFAPSEMSLVVHLRTSPLDTRCPDL